MGWSFAGSAYLNREDTSDIAASSGAAYKTSTSRRQTTSETGRPRQPRDRQHGLLSSCLTLPHQVPADPSAPYRVASFDAEIWHIFPIDPGETGL